MKLRILFVCVVNATVVCNAMGQILPSPSSTGLIRAVANSGSLFTGSTSIDVPIYNASGVPVTLSYQTTGIRVDQESTPVGLGWNLIAGGEITRITRGFPDDQYFMRENVEQLNYGLVRDLLDSIKDGEKDLFYFNYPGGSGQFFFKGNWVPAMDWCSNNSSYNQCVNDCEQSLQEGIDCNIQCADQLNCTPDEVIATEVIVTPHSDIKIEYDEVMEKWIITDLAGVRYTFSEIVYSIVDKKVYDELDATTNAINGVKLGYKEYSVDYDSLDNLVSNSSKTQINSILATKYEDNRIITSWKLTQISFPDRAETIDFTYVGHLLDYEKENIQIFPRRATTGDVLFNPLQSRFRFTQRDYTQVKHLSKISFRNGAINFNYTDDRSDIKDLRLSSIELKDHNDRVVSSTWLDNKHYSDVGSRLKLKGIYKQGGLVRSFVYKDSDPETYSNGDRKYALPKVTSNFYDHWGFYNNGDHQTMDVEWPDLDNVTIEHDGIDEVWNLPGVDREPSESAMANTLIQVNYPTGGYTKFDYELHFHNESIVGGGLRLKSIMNYDHLDKVVSGSTFTYDQPYYLDKPRYADFLFSETDYVFVAGRNWALDFDINGANLGYGKVVETDFNGQGRTEYLFNADPELDSIRPVKRFVRLDDQNSALTEIATVTNDHPPFVTNSLKFYKRGSLKKVEIFGADDPTNPIRRTEYFYTDLDFIAYTIENLVVRQEEKLGPLTNVFIGGYDIVVRPFLPDSSVTTTFDNGGQVSVKNKTTYHETFKTLPKETISTSSNGYSSKQLITYPHDVINSSIHDNVVLDSMTSKHMLGLPVMTESQQKLPHYTDFKTFGVGLTKSKIEHGLLLPHQVYALELLNPVSTWSEMDLTLMQEMIDYNEKGDLLKSKGLDGIEKNVLIDEHGYLVENSVNDLASKYSYKPLVGVDSVTDVNGRKVTYNYDFRNRLDMVRNDQGNILAKYNYSLATDNPNLAANLAIKFPDGNATGDGVIVRLVNLNCPSGTCSYSLSWGDGNMISDFDYTREYAHSYNSVGSKTITLTVSNPDFSEDLVVSEEILIGDLPIGVVEAYVNPTDGNDLFVNHTFTLESINCPTGDCNTLWWVWSDGLETQQLMSNGWSTPQSITRQFNSTGSYQVKVEIGSPTYGDFRGETNSAAINVFDHHEWQLDISGPPMICQSNNASYTSNIAGDCSGVTYSWKYKESGDSSWSAPSNNDAKDVSITFPSSPDTKFYVIELTATGCNRSRTDQTITTVSPTCF